LQGGYETYTCRFRLSGARGELSNPLVLRLYPRFYGTDNAVWESTIQNVLADEGYPVARAYLVCTDVSILGGAFYVMACLPGELMMTAGLTNAGTGSVGDSTG
jgi:aminoglycoside phosphotransferase (APT) family kinase protein